MWEKDKLLLKAYRDCITNFVADLKSGEEADYGSACKEEADKILHYASCQGQYIMEKNPSENTAKVQTFYNPRMPFFQNF